MTRISLSSSFLEYLASMQTISGGEEVGRVPPLSELSKKLGVSISSLREQLEVAKALGLVEVRPRTGIHRRPYSFFPAVAQSLSYAIALDRENFKAFSDLRNRLEICYWHQAVHLLLPEDHQFLRDLVVSAWNKLHDHPILIPQIEHQQLHLAIYRRLNNPYVMGILEAYWDAYEAVGLSYYADYNYLQQVWQYHEHMVEAICSGDYEAGYQALVAHFNLLFQRPALNSNGDGWQALINPKGPLKYPSE